MELLHFDIDTFLRDFWQKKPCVIRNPWPQWGAPWANPVDPDELAGLACEEGIEARMISHGSQKWQAEHGPFPEDRFASVKAPWTLLVQAVDHHVPEVAALIEPFRFVPDWRIDDVMVSYATDQGGVGPHYDHYDVFLIQGLGRRRWQVGQLCDEHSPLLPHDDLRLLADFQVAQEWVLEPGDILYCPPRVAHDGVALGDDCMTYSVGFRAPAREELIAHWTDAVIEGLADDDRYTDPDLPRQANPGEITPAALDRLQAMMLAALGNREAFAQWFGEYTSTRKYPEVDWRPEEETTLAQIRKDLFEEAPLCRNPASRFAFVRAAPSLTLFVDGQAYACQGLAASFAQQLCAGGEILLTPDQIASDAVMELIVTLFNQGSVAFDE
jgi:50S ribosomal protein L16 3-hydroxylase